LNLPTLPAQYVEDLARTLRIAQHEGGATAPWAPTIEQTALWACQEHHPWVYATKSRQTGVTTAALLADLLWTNAADSAGHVVNCALVIDTVTKGEAKIAIASDWVRQLGFEARCLTSGITFPGGSTLTYVSAHVDEPARSGTLHRLHLTELPFWANPTKAYTSLMQALALGCGVTIETTIAPSRDNLARDLWRGDNEYHKLFMPLQAHSEYRTDSDSISNDEWDRLRGLGFTRRDSAAWFAWARDNKCGGDEVRALREYPQKPEHMFQSAAGRWVATTPNVLRAASTVVCGEWVAEVYHAADASKGALIAVDTATGKGQDHSAIAVLDRATGSLLAAFTSDRVTIDDLAAMAAALCDRFTRVDPVYSVTREPTRHRPTVLVESNGIGNATLQACYRLGLPVVDVVTTEASRYEGLLAAKRAIESGKLAGPARLAEECDDLHRDDLGRFVGAKDLLMACGFALRHINANPVPMLPSPDNRNKFNMLDKIVSKRNAWKY